MVQLDMMRRVAAHAWLDFPPMRGLSDAETHGGCKQCGNGKGVCGDGGQWPEHSDHLGYVKGPQTDFRAGEIVDFVIELTTNHQGHFEFGICKELLTHDTTNPEDCVGQVKLKRVAPPDDCVANDERWQCQPMLEGQQERWYLPPVPDPSTVKMRFQIPMDFECEACTLRWRWWTGNSCVPVEGYGCYFENMRKLGWDAVDKWCHNGQFCGTCGDESQTGKCDFEEFRNCADISVTKGTGPAPTPTTPAPTTTSALPTSTAAPPAPTTPAPTTPAPPTSTAAPTSVPPSGSCVPNPDCVKNPWCKDPSYEDWCEYNSEECPDQPCMRV